MLVRLEAFRSSQVAAVVAPTIVNFGTASLASADPQDITFTVGATSEKLVLGFTIDPFSAPRIVNSVTWYPDGVGTPGTAQTLTKRVVGGTDGEATGPSAQFWDRDAPTAAVGGTIRIDMDGTASMGAAIWTLSGAAVSSGGNPIVAVAAATAAGVSTAIDPFPGSLILDKVCLVDPAIRATTVTAGQTEVQDQDASTAHSTLASQLVSVSGAATAMAWTFASQSYAHAVVSYVGTGGAGGGQAAPVLGISGSKFTIDGTPTFLLGVSYFQARWWHSSDIDQLAALGFNLVRMFVNFNTITQGTHFDADNSGNLDAAGTTNLINFVDYCGSKGIIVDVTIFPQNRFSGDLTAETNGVTDVATALLDKPNVLFDIRNEHDIASPASTHSRIGTLIGIIKGIDPDRICTVSSGAGNAHLVNIDTVVTANVDDEIATADVDVIDPHLDRTTDWWSKTGLRTRNLVAYLASTTVKPVYLGEEERNIGTDPPSKSHFIAAAQGCLDNGGAAWNFHNEACFDLTTTSMFDQMNSFDLDTIDKLPRTIFPQTYGLIDFGDGNNTRYYSIPHDAALDLGSGAWAIFFWIRIDDNAGTVAQYFISCGASGSTSSVNIFLSEATEAGFPNKLRLNITDDAALALGSLAGSSTPGADGRRRLIVVQSTGTTTEMWEILPGVTPVRIINAAVNLGAITPTVAWNIGRRADADATRYMEEWMGGIGWVDRALTSTEMTQLTLDAVPATLLGANLKEYFAFKNGSGATEVGTVVGTVATRNGTGWV